MTAAMTRLLALLARGTAQDRFRGMHEYMSEPRSPWWGLVFWVGVLALVTIFLIAGFRHLTRSRRRSSSGGPWRTFFRLIRAAPLTWAQRGLLWSMARNVSPDQPAAILLTPSALFAAASAWAERESEPPARMLARVQPIAQILFGENARPEPPGQSEEKSPRTEPANSP